jgi:serine/threonine protein kinase
MPPEVLAAAENPKSIFGKYVLVRELGRGGMGVVYKSWDTSLSRWVALKFLIGEGSSPEGEHASEEVQRFIREAQTCASLTHPNICRVYEVGRRGDKHFIAMQFIEGESLAQKRLAPQKTAQMIAKVALALHHAHQQGIVHRDVKPANIMTDKDGEPVVMDFGLARSVQGGTHLTQSGAVMGTPQYMPPEQVAGNLQKIGPRSDVYALGATMYHLLTGRPPFRGKNAYEVMTKVVNEDAPAPHSVNQSLPLELDAICMMAMQKDIARRYPSAKAFAEDINGFLQGESIVAQPESSLSTLVRKVRKKRNVFIPLAVAAGAIILALVYLQLQASRRGTDFINARRQADDAFDTKRYQEALEFYAKAAQLKPSDQYVADRKKECQSRMDDETKRAETARNKEKDERVKAEQARIKAELEAEAARKKTEEDGGRTGQAKDRPGQGDPGLFEGQVRPRRGAEGFLQAGCGPCPSTRTAQESGGQLLRGPEDLRHSPRGADGQGQGEGAAVRVRRSREGFHACDRSVPGLHPGAA